MKEEVCHAIAGCWVDTKTGECPDCVLETREVAHTHEVTPVIVEKPEIAENPVVKKPLVVKTTPKKRVEKESVVTTPWAKTKWVGTLFKCEVGCRYAYWDSAGNNYDKNMNRVYN